MTQEKKNNSRILYYTLATSIFLSPSNIPNLHAEVSTDVVKREDSEASFKYLTLEQLIKIFCGELTEWPNGEPIYIVMYKPTSTQHKVFIQDQLRITLSEYKRRMDRSKKIDPFLESRIVYVDSEEDMVKQLLRNEYAIGYIFNLVLYKNKEDLIAIYIDK